MSSLPLLLDLIDELDREAFSPAFYGNDFGFGIYPQHIHRRAQEPTALSLLGYKLPLDICGRLRDRRAGRHGDKKQDGGQLCPVGKDGFQVCMDVAQFKPSELNVKVVDNSVVVEGKHEEREDQHGYISRHFVRRYALPKGYDPEKVVSTLSSDGVLTVSIPKPQIEDKSNERVIQIQQTGPAHLNVKENTQEKVGDSANSSNGGDGKKEK